MEKFDSITLFSITQGILIAIISRIVTALYRQKIFDSSNNFEGLFETNYLAASFIMSSMVFLSIMSIISILERYATVS
jgi:hypothetical protein